MHEYEYEEGPFKVIAVGRGNHTDWQVWEGQTLVKTFPGRVNGEAKGSRKGEAIEWVNVQMESRGQ